MSFIDDFFRMTWIYFLKKKVEVFENFLEFKDLVENQTDRKIKVLRTNNGGELCGRSFTSSVNSMVYLDKTQLLIYLNKIEL